MHRKVRRFGMDGKMGDDSMFTTTKEYYEKLIVDDMREQGFVPVLGMGPYFATSYNIEKDDYDFVVTAYGVFVGERKSWRIEGIELDTGTLFPKSTRPSKLKQPSTPSESK
jgi:hypothetical protein